MKALEYWLEDWFLAPWCEDYSKWVAHGKVFGNPKFAPGYRIHTSRVQAVQFAEDSLLMVTENSRYRCAYKASAEQTFDFLNAAALLGEQVTEGVKERISRCMAERFAVENEEVLAGVPGNDDCLVLSFTTGNESYFNHCLLRLSGEVYRLRCTTHLGMFQDSILIDGFEIGHAEIDYRYFPHFNNAIEFYSWSGYTGPIYMRNTGPGPLSVKAVGKDYTLPPTGALLQVQ